ncbi:MAG TPA: penicillin-binding transpeptidase domain-containing protein [Baekduia sp.]|uniref:penicillin-binding transpeptidase domain-containing protein n=1 Tax=Baekduia sp. TaxID=2600305 RepID=UPI002C1973F9|nr:penicillin-binding transpeptidase domain-containing protein [Baekduia sp.]HMJ32496.1 penicillin-binding transpeptidase domain-containing protein [Baekduia sp.]
MPLDPANDRRPPITPQLALRVAGVGVLAFVLFGIVFFRLWYLQVLDGDRYLAQARENRVRTERIQAPRGQIVDASKIPLVDNRKATVVSLDPASIPAAMRTQIAAYGQKAGQREARKKGRKGPKIAVPQATGDLLTRYRRLGNVLQLSPKTINQRVVDAIVQVPYANIRVKTGVPAAQRDYIEERRERFPGVTVEQLYVRTYPNKTMAAQLLGVVGQIRDYQLKDKKNFKGIAGGTDIGQSGLEAQYDKQLRGTDGQYRIEVNAAGERRRAVVAVQPKSGQQLKLTLHQELQQAGETALKTAGHGLPGAFVALNPQTGAVYAMGSSPSYNPREAAPGYYATTAAYRAHFGTAAGSPQVNRADESAYPTGSIFKPVTALAALDSGTTTTDRVFNDQGCYQTGARTIDKACNAGGKAYGNVNLVSALRVSADTYFYDLGKKMYDQSSLPLQSWAHKLGVARRTGIDLPGEATGTIPSPSEVRRINRLEAACRKKNGGKPCYIGSGNALWNPGDNENFAVGQGGLQATPLQMAVVYSTIVNGGRVPTPHLGLQTEDSRGIAQPLDFPSKRKVAIKPQWQSAIMQGLFGAANENGGTSKGVFDNGWPRNRFPVYGKTGTAERQPQKDQSWYAVYSYDKSNPDAKPIVVVVTVEQGGFGADAAAPAARLILSKWFGVAPRIVRGTSTDR